MEHSYPAINPVEPLKLADIINVDDIQSMMDNFYNLTHIPTAIIELNGKVIAGAGWQNVCVNFHRANAETNKNCIESDTQLTTCIPEGEFKLYKCKNDMWDLATPIMIEGRHLGNLYMGQFFFKDEAIDYESFRLKARRYGFNEADYINAIDAVPRITHIELNNAKAFFTGIAKSISQLSYNNIMLARLLKERDQLMSSLSQSEERFRNIFEKPKAVMLLIDPASGNILDANTAAANFYGWTREQLCKMKIQEINSLTENEVKVELQEALKEKRNHFIFLHRLADNSTRYVEVYSSPILIKGEQKLFSVIHDITERKKIEDELLKSEENFRAILDATQEAVVMYNRDGLIITANETAARRVNRPMEDVKGNHISNIFPDEISHRHLKYNTEVFNSGCPFRFEDEYNGKSSVHNLYPVFDKDKVVNIVCYNQDVTAYRVSEKLFEHLASFPRLNPNPILEIDVTGRITFYNEAAVNTLRAINAEENIHSFIPEDIEEIINELHRSQYLILDREIIINDHIFSESIHYAKQLNVLRIYATDVTKNKKAEEQLRKLSNAFEHSPSSIMITDSTGRIEYVNPVFTKITGYSPEEVAGKNPKILQSGKTSTEEYRLLWQTITSGRQWHGAFQNKNKAGELYWESVNISPVFNERGSITHFVAVKEDITERIKYEEQLKKLNRTLNALRHSGDALVRATDEQSYLNDICSIIVEDCGHALVWIGYAENDKRKSVRPVASGGFEEGYLENLNISWADNKYGRGPTGTAIRTGEITACNNILTDPKFAPWREQAIKRGYSSSLVLPLKHNNITFGAISIYSRDVQPFSDNEINLLSELADDLSYGITVIRLRYDHLIAEKELKEHRDNLEGLVQLRTKELEMANQILKEAQEVAHIGHWQLNLNTNKLTWSDEIFRIFGVDSNSFSVSLEGFLNCIHPEDREYVLQSYKRSVDEKNFYSIDHRIIRPDNQVRTVHEQCVTYYDDENAPLYSLGVCQDITEYKLAEHEIEKHRNHLEELVKIRTEELAIINRQLKDEVEKERQVEMLLKESLEKERGLNELKSRFISTTSHEFRTPLTSILSSMQLIQRYRKKWADEKVEDQFQKIKDSVFNLTKLLDDILVISHADSGRITLIRQKTDLQQFCEKIIDEVKHLVLDTHKFTFKFKSDKKEFDIDPKLMRFIILNLLSNAFKYSPQGGKVNLLISYSSSKLDITVSDEGIGVPRNDLDNLFKPFFRSSNTGEIEGTGLGLSIVQRAVEMHNGTIKCTPNKTKGTKFMVVIPGV